MSIIIEHLNIRFPDKGEGALGWTKFSGDTCFTKGCMNTSIFQCSSNAICGQCAVEMAFGDDSEKNK